jgi:hypothetical protein
MEGHMKIKILQLIFLLILAFGLAPVSQAEGLKYKATYDGTFLDTSFDINEDGFFTDVVRGSGQGTFGQSDTVIVTEFLPLGVTGECASEDDLRLIVIYSKGVATYSKGEQLYTSSGGGYICVDLATGDYEGLATGVFDGGTGRFENAYGNFETRFSGRNLTFPVGLPFGFGSINGVTTGLLYLK